MNILEDKINLYLWLVILIIFIYSLVFSCVLTYETFALNNGHIETLESLNPSSYQLVENK